MPDVVTGTVTGWDIGGAHLKCSHLSNRKITDIKQIRCPLWQGEEELTTAIQMAGSSFMNADYHHVTMTGELAECFSTRAEGVKRIVSQCERLLNGTIFYYAIGKGFVCAKEAKEQSLLIASANWHATACYIAEQYRDAILIDVGSTTTDIIPIVNGAVVAKGLTDVDRLKWGELVYSGVTRTSLMSIAQRVPFKGEWHPVMHENFSQTADIYRMTGEIEPEDDAYPASDKRSKQFIDCTARLARMLGLDNLDARDEAWQKLALYFREQQLRLLQDALHQVLSRLNVTDIPIIGAGAGHFLIRVLAERTNLTYLESTQIVGVTEHLKQKARTCAPAVALALMKHQN